MDTPAPNISPQREAFRVPAPGDEISAALMPIGSFCRVVVPVRVNAVGVSSLYVSIAVDMRHKFENAFAFENGWYAVDNDEGVTWCRGHEGEAVDALKAACALR